MWCQERAAKWRTPDGLMDGLTTNGVLVMHPAGGFSEDSAPGVWREISVCGNVYTLRDSRSAQQRGKLVGGLLHPVTRPSQAAPKDCVSGEGSPCATCPADRIRLVSQRACTAHRRPTLRCGSDPHTSTPCGTQRLGGHQQLKAKTTAP